MARKTRVQSQVKSYQRLKKMVLDNSLLNTQNYKVWVKWLNPGKGVAPSPTPWCSSYWKRSLRFTLDYGHQLYLLFINKYPKQYCFMIIISPFCFSGKFCTFLFITDSHKVLIYKLELLMRFFNYTIYGDSFCFQIFKLFYANYNDFSLFFQFGKEIKAK